MRVGSPIMTTSNQTLALLALLVGGALTPLACGGESKPAEAPSSAPSASGSAAGSGAAPATSAAASATGEPSAAPAASAPPPSPLAKVLMTDSASVQKL